MFKEIKNKYWHAIMVIYFLIYMPWFSWLNVFTSTRPDAVEMYCKLDDMIPFNEWFVIPYFLWFLYIAAGYIFLFFNNRSDFLRMCTFLYVGMTTCLIIYMIFPNYQDLRVDYETLGRSNILTEAIRLLQLGDSNYDVFPSIHCLNSIGMNIALAKNKWCRKRPWIIALVTLLSISICLSTVFVKQHSVLDMFGAIGLSVPLYLISYVIPWRKIFKRRTKKECA
ncbi:MAG: hypothetical protein IJN34_06795 [Clostridia bacterium]|nr:hypothetical protein [Clostridia bacterium]